MARFQTIPSKPGFFDDGVKNDHSAALPRGTPVALTLDGTENGLAVVPPSASAAKANAFFYGVTLDASIPINELGSVRRSGLVPYAVIRRQTRAASSDAWVSEVSLATGFALTVDTVNNAFSTVASLVTIASDASTILTNLLLNGLAVLANSLASYASSASATSDTRTAITTNAAVFLRAM